MTATESATHTHVVCPECRAATTAPSERACRLWLAYHTHDAENGSSDE